MSAGKGRGSSKKKNQQLQNDNPLGTVETESSRSNNAGVINYSAVTWQPVLTNSSTSNTVQSSGYNTHFKPNEYPQASSAEISSSQLAPNMPLHELLAMLSSHPALQNPAAQAYATNLVMENHSAMLTPTLQGQINMSNAPIPGPKNPIPVLSSVTSNSASAGTLLRMPHHGLPPVCNPPIHTTSSSSNIQFCKGSTPLDFSQNRETGNDGEVVSKTQVTRTETYNPVDAAGRVETFNTSHLVRNIRATNTASVVRVGPNNRTPNTPKNHLPKNANFHLLPANVDKPFPLSDVMIYKQDGFGAQIIKIGKMDSAEKVGETLQTIFPILVGHTFNVVTERSHQAGPRKFVFQKEGPPSGVEIQSAPLRNLIIYIQPHTTLSRSVTRTETRAGVPEVVWRYIPSVSSTSQIDAAASSVAHTPHISPFEQPCTIANALTSTSSNVQGAVDNSIIASTTVLQCNKNNAHSLLEIPNTPNSCGFQFNLDLNTPHGETSWSRTRGDQQFGGNNPARQLIFTPDKAQTSLSNHNDDNCEDDTFSELAMSQETQPAEDYTKDFVATENSSNFRASLGDRALEIIENANRNGKNSDSIPDTIDTERITSSEENELGDVHGTSSSLQRSQRVFRFPSGGSPPYHGGVLYRAPSVLQYPKFHPSSAGNRVFSFAGNTSASANYTGADAQQESVVEIRTSPEEIETQEAVTPESPEEPFRPRRGRPGVFDVLDGTLDGYTLKSPQGFNLNLGDRSAGRREVCVRRSMFENNYLNYYINLGRKNVNMRRLLRVSFIGDDGEEEPAADAGGPRGEYISMLRERIRYGFWEGFPLFDYSDNNLLPSKVPLLGENGTFFAVGLAMTDLIFNSGSSIEGLAPQLIEALQKMQSGNHPYIDTVKKSDFLDEDVQEAFELLTFIASKDYPANSHVERLQVLCSDWDVNIPDGLTYRSALKKRNSLAQSYFVESRISALWDLYEGLCAGGVMHYLSIYTDQWETLFPRKGSLEITAEELMNYLEFRDDLGAILQDTVPEETENHEIIVRQYVRDIAGDSGKIRHFLMCSTGYDVLTPGKIIVEPQFDPFSEQVKFTACSKTIAVPLACTLEYFSQAVALDLDYNRG